MCYTQSFGEQYLTKRHMNYSRYIFNTWGKRHIDIKKRPLSRETDFTIKLYFRSLHLFLKYTIETNPRTPDYSILLHNLEYDVMNMIILFQFRNKPRLRIGLERLVGCFSGWTSRGVTSGSLESLEPLKLIACSGSGDWKILLFFHLLILLKRWTNSPILPRCLFNISRVRSGIPL